MPEAYTHLHFKRHSLNREGFHLCVEFTEATSGHPKTTDQRKDCCESCMATGLEAIAKRLRESAAVQAESKGQE